VAFSWTAWKQRQATSRAGHGEVAAAFHTCRQAATDRTSKRALLASDRQSSRSVLLQVVVVPPSLQVVVAAAGWASTASCAAARLSDRSTSTVVAKHCLFSCYISWVTGAGAVFYK
jgi:hypothetical protein